MPKISTGEVYEQCVDLKARLDGSVLVFFGGTPPTDANNAAGSTPLATSSPLAWTAPGASDPKLELTAPVNYVTAAAGTMTWALLTDPTDTFGASTTKARMVFSVGVTSGDIRVGTTVVEEAGITGSISSLTFSKASRAW